jgi:hypothetical protein
MAKNTALQRLDRAVDRVGYWHDTGLKLYVYGGALFTAISAVGGGVWFAWRYIQMMAANIGWGVYAVVAAACLFSVIGIAATVIKTIRLFRNKAPEIPESETVQDQKPLQLDTPKPEPLLTPKRPLTAYEAERKLKVVDAGLEMLKEMREIIAWGRRLHAERWYADDTRIVEYPDEVQDLITALRAFCVAADAHRNDNQEYQDVMLALQQTYFNESVNALAVYMNACRDVSKALQSGAPVESVMGLYRSYEQGFEATLAAMEAWHNKARGDLGDIRKEIEKAPIAEHSSSADAPKFHLHCLGGNTFRPNGLPGRNSAFAITTRIWNTGTEGFPVKWQLRVNPKNQAPDAVEPIDIAPFITIAGRVGTTITEDQSLLKKLEGKSVGRNPVEGLLLFPSRFTLDVLNDEETQFELTVEDNHGGKAVFVKRMGDWPRSG